MKYKSKIALLLAILQFLISSLVSWFVYLGADPYAGEGALLYFALIGYCPWALISSLVSKTGSVSSIFPEIGLDDKLISNYLPSILFATINWMILGFIIGLIIDLCYKKVPGTKETN